MIIENITSQTRRDFYADLICEFCNHKQKLTDGYDDDYYHQEVIPNICCEACGKSTISGVGKIQPYKTKYPKGFIV